MLFCSALDQKVLILLRIHKKLWNSVVNHTTEKGDIIKQIGSKYGANTKVRWSLFCSALEQKGFDCTKNYKIIVEGCCESNWWRRGHNKTNRTQYGANISVKWCLFLQCCRSKGFDFTENYKMIVEGCCESNWWRRGHNKTNRTQYGANTSVMWCFFAVL